MEKAPAASRVHTIAFALLVVLATSGCWRDWSSVRSEFVDPLNAFLHHAYADAWKTGDLEAVEALYAPLALDDAGAAAARRELFGRFAEIEYAYSIIERVDRLDGDDLVRASLILRVRGIAPSSERLSVERRLLVECARAPGGEWRVTRERFEGETVARASAPLFSSEAASRGLTFRHRSSGVFDKFGRIQDYSPGAGLAVGDSDGDGFEDVALVGGAELRLYRNRGDGTFEDVTEASGLGKLMAGEGRCAVFGDCDNDGDQDLFVGRIDAPNLLYRNDGGGRFEEIGRRAGIVPGDTSLFETTGACFADFDNDGWLDLYVINGGNLLRRHPDPMYNALDATPNQLWMGNGDGTFTNRTAEAGVGHPGWALALSPCDYDLDGDVDIFVGNDVGFNVLYRNRGDAFFENVTLPAGLVYRGTTMSAAWGDLDGDGLPDLFGAAMDSNSRWMISQPSFPAPAPWFINLVIRGRVLEILEEMLWGNRVYRNRGDGSFQEISSDSGLRRNGWAWSTCFLDFDNDGDQDLYSVNGFISGEKPKDL